MDPSTEYRDPIKRRNPELAEMLTIAKDAGEAIIIERARGLVIKEKNNAFDLLTNCDPLGQKKIVDAVKQRWPTVEIIAEEGIEGRYGASDLIVIDPIDGTYAFAHGGDDWGIIISRFANGVPTQAVMYQPDKKRGFVCDNTGYNCLIAPSNQHHKRVGFHSSSVVVSVGGAPLSHYTAAFITRIKAAGIAVFTTRSSVEAQLAFLFGEVGAYLSPGELLWDVGGILPLQHMNRELSFTSLSDNALPSLAAPRMPAFVVARSHELAQLVKSSFHGDSGH